MSMLMPTRRNRNLLSDFMFDPFDAFFNTPTPAASTPTLMRTDIKETANGFEMTIDLPGFKKEDVLAELKDGYLHIEAQTKSESEDKDASGTYVRKERFSGKCSRTFYPRIVHPFSSVHPFYRIHSPDKHGHAIPPPSPHGERTALKNSATRKESGLWPLSCV